MVKKASATSYMMSLRVKPSKLLQFVQPRDTSRNASSHLSMRSMKSIRISNICSLNCTTLHRAGKTYRRQLLWLRSVTTMTPRKDSISHETRTAAEPRQNKLYTVRLARVEQVNPSVRLLRLALPQEAPSDETAVHYLSPLIQRTTGY
jgi:hypothetical protein